jgi:hypothetical protein
VDDLEQRMVTRGARHDGGVVCTQLHLRDEPEELNDDFH